MDVRHHNNCTTLLLQEKHLKHGNIVLFGCNELYVQTLIYFSDK